MFGNLLRRILEWLRRLVCLIQRLFTSNENSFNMTECIYGWRAAYRVDEERCTLRVTVRIRLNPDPDVTAAELGALRATWETGIEQRWSNRFPLVRQGGSCECEAYAVTFDVQFVGSGEHHTVRVRRGPARSNMTTWDTADDGGAASHEFGHMLGFPDEYPDPNCPARTVTNDNSIMQTNAGNPRQRHYQPFARWVSRRTCCDYAVS